MIKTTKNNPVTPFLRISGIIIMGMMTVITAGCTHSNKSRPGVFATSNARELEASRQQPLVIPPDFTLSPPKPGTPRPQDTDSSTQALAVMFGQPAVKAAAERGLLEKASARLAQPGIRTSVSDAQTETVNKGGLTSDIVSSPAKEDDLAVVKAGGQDRPNVPTIVYKNSPPE
ncbi:MAG: DUF3035 domain-containing protein [Zymomonas mobilis subsp. pomaceae]|uniref:Beta-barrel assembly complex subunit BamF n=1 Tax=Zymomonas mobilis subsp. pomaceae (strain ATCC 29192 / DSM 22645 / JCM 10191 / CCUG 17912 / NBRC 13757 / NCIMB 11200 / NRRL B-4491 / Barker I) TaxID=579138 RepID=F8ESJ0_ZYMMT|nr:DUF3035 domain-containing protein [Zymomonas mobilis]AEI37765.1 hypothetical protein Zymop_0865 [Zymomonas mobilis subsp. pomaceae ATCC 29192]MDX5949132.1 DUF3035 domain-containing protein [Zymomonas mobilis subsp. pomaceae]GEB88939.1 hypothetical protein ZMO02_05760 [Zymomonas mobilis subsp. pomaceae]